LIGPTFLWMTPCS